MEQVLLALIGVLGTAVSAMAWQLRSLRRNSSHNPHPEHIILMDRLNLIRETQLEIRRDQVSNEQETRRILESTRDLLIEIKTFVEAIHESGRAS